MTATAFGVLNSYYSSDSDCKLVADWIRLAADIFLTPAFTTGY